MKIAKKILPLIIFVHLQSIAAELSSDSVAMNSFSSSAYKNLTESRGVQGVSDWQIYSGEVKVFDTKDINRVAVGNGKIVSATILENSKLLLIGKDVGDTNILLWTKNGLQQNLRIRVTASDINRVVSDVRNALSQVKSASIRTVGDRIYIDGNNLSTSEKKQVTEISKYFSNVVDNTLMTAPIKPPADSSSMVMFDVYFVEFKKNYFQEIGVNWKKSISGMNIGMFGESNRGRLNLRPGISSEANIPSERQNGISTAINLSLSLPGIINIAVNSGNATLLAAPKLAVRSGGSAKFLAGGEFPIAVSGITGNTVEYKQYGILLEVEPTINTDSTISGLIKTEVSGIDRSLTINGFPGLFKRRTETDFFSEMNQAIILSGLYTQEISNAADKIPLLGDIPILKGLFSNRAESRNSSELVVFIVPKPHSSQDAMNREVISKSQATSELQNIENTKNQLLPKPNFESRMFNGYENGYTKGTLPPVPTIQQVPPFHQIAPILQDSPLQ